MAFIEIKHLSGHVEQRKLSRGTPLSIGSHSSNSICIEEEGVAVLHCRISWSGKSYEVMSGSADGIEVNSNLVQHAPLKEGDLLRIGSLDLVFHEKKTAPAPAPEEDSIGLQAVTDDEIPLLKRATDVAREMGGSSDSPKPTQREPKQESFPAKKPIGKSPPAKSQPANDEDDDWFDDPDFDDHPDSSKRDHSASSKLGQLKERLAGQPVRPGEQDAVRSPLVLTLGGGALALLLVAATVWFIIGRETSQKHFAAAQAQLDEGNYQQATQLFESFIAKYPRHSQAEEARYGLGKAKIQIALAGATPNWQRSLEELQTFVKLNRDRPNYDSQVEGLQKISSEIAFGAAKSVVALAKRRSSKPEKLNELLDVSRQAGTAMARLYPADQQPAKLDSQLADAHWNAEQAIATRKAYLATVSDMNQAIKKSKPQQVVAARNKLVTDHNIFRNDRQLIGLLDASLKIEQKLVRVDDISRQAETADRPSTGPPPLSLIRHTYSGTGEKSVGRTVFAIAKDCCYGIDTITGEPLWRRIVGLDTPFFPMAVDTSVSGILLFDTRHNELQMLERRTGQLVWRQPLETRVSGEPLLHEGRAYVATDKGQLYQIVLETGQVAKRLSFPQALVAPPILVRNKSQLIIAGRASFLYTLSLRPLKPLSVSFSNHASGSVAVPLLTMGSLLLLAENNSINNGRLRVFDTRRNKAGVKEIASAAVTGRIRNRPVIRGRQLFVTSTPERITAFAVSEDKEQPPILRTAETRITGTHNGPLYLKAGADDRLWMAGSAFRSFRLLTDAIAYDEAKRAATGITTQPLQYVDRYFYVGRRQPYHRAALLTPVERDQLTSHWGTLCGSAPIAVNVSNDQLTCVTETGDVYQATRTKVEQGGFVTQATTRLPIADATETPIAAHALTNNSLAVWVGDPKPELWLFDQSGRINREISLPQPLEAAPIALQAGVVLPLPGRLKLVRQNGGSPVEDYSAPLQQGNPPKWQHLLPLDEDEFLVMNDSGRLSRIQFRDADVPHLAEVDSVNWPHPVDFAPVIAGDRLVIADASQQVSMLNLSSLETVSESKLELAASNQPWIIDGSLFVETGRKTLQELRIENGQLIAGWSLPLQGNSLVGAPLEMDGHLVLGLKNGTLFLVDRASGKLLNRMLINQPLALGIQRLGDLLVAPTLDGSLHRIEGSRLTSDKRRVDP